MAANTLQIKALIKLLFGLVTLSLLGCIFVLRERIPTLDMLDKRSSTFCEMPPQPTLAPNTISSTTTIDTQEPFRTIEEVVRHTTRFEVFDDRNPAADPNQKKVVIMTILRDSKSWTQQGFAYYLDMITAFDYPPEYISLALMVSSDTEFSHMKALLLERYERQALRYPHVTLIYKHEEENLQMANRHEPNMQKVRRRKLARLRNFLLFSALRHEDAVLWIDADMAVVPNDALSIFINSDKDIITTLCTYRGGDYDLNAWVGPRTKPTPEEYERIKSGELVWDPRPIYPMANHVMGLRNPSQPQKDYAVEIDAVGGTLLFVKADVHRQGVVFATNYLVGADWGMDGGYDGIETEGLCYVAKPLGYKCWAMPHIVTNHGN